MALDHDLPIFVCVAAAATPAARASAPRPLVAPALSNRQWLKLLAARAVQREPAAAEAAAAEAAPAPPVPVTRQERMAYVMGLLVDTYGYPEVGAAGLVGNLMAESGLLANRIEGSKPDSAMTAKNAQGVKTEFTPEEVMNRQYKVSGPQKPGVGIAQWTTASRRAGLFQHKYKGAVLGAAILHNLDAQVDYLVKELESQYKGVNKVLKSAESVEDASDEVVFNFERPAALLQDKTDADGEVVYKTRKNKQGKVVDVLDKQGNKQPLKSLRSRTDPAVQGVLQTRRGFGRAALAAYREQKSNKSNPAPAP
jgi:hypothetical protein